MSWFLWFALFLCSLPLYEGVDWNPVLYDSVCTLLPKVSLFTREWIEIDACINPVRNQSVSLFTREWIEIENEVWQDERTWGLPLYEGVDWNSIPSEEVNTESVSLFTREWIEIFSFQSTFSEILCLPLYEGVDWNRLQIRYSRQPDVSLFTREWIEILIPKATKLSVSRLPLYEGVDWNPEMMRQKHVPTGLPLYEGVDWNHHFAWFFCLKSRLPLYEGVDWNSGATSRRQNRFGLPLYEGVDWNIHFVQIGIYSCTVSLFTREWIEIWTREHQNQTDTVSLFTREWIEIEVLLLLQWAWMGLPLYEGVDWNSNPINGINSKKRSPSLRGSGLKSKSMQEAMPLNCLPLYEGVDWNFCVNRCISCINGLPLYEGVDWNICIRSADVVQHRVSLFTREWIEI